MVCKKIFFCSCRDLGNNEISWAIEDANEAFVGLSRLDKLYVLQNISDSASEANKRGKMQNIE